MWRRLGIEQGEGRLFAWAASTLFLLGWAYVSVTNVSEVFFIKRIDVRYLPLAFLVSSAVLVVTSLSLGRLGFEVEALYGDFERSEFAGESPEMVFVARKR